VKYPRSRPLSAWRSLSWPASIWPIAKGLRAAVEPAHCRAGNLDARGGAIGPGCSSADNRRAIPRATSDSSRPTVAERIEIVRPRGAFFDRYKPVIRSPGTGSPRWTTLYRASCLAPRPGHLSWTQLLGQPAAILKWQAADVRPFAGTASKMSAMKKNCVADAGLFVNARSLTQLRLPLEPFQACGDTSLNLCALVSRVSRVG
jgi:hypothetical protein